MVDFPDGCEIPSHHEMKPWLKPVGIWGIESFQGCLGRAKWISSIHGDIAVVLIGSPTSIPNSEDQSRPTTSPKASPATGVSRSSSREVTRRVPFFLLSILVGEPSKKKVGKRAPCWGT